MLKKIDHINVVVKDLEQSKNFFLNLGFSVQREGILEGEWIDKLTEMRKVKAVYVGLTLPGHETNLELLHFISHENLTTWDNDVPNKTGFRHLSFEVDDIESFENKLKALGIDFVTEVQNYEGTDKKLCFFKGPEGIMLELAEYIHEL